MSEFQIPTDIDELMSPGPDNDGFKVQRVFKLTEIPKCLDGKTPPRILYYASSVLTLIVLYSFQMPSERWTRI